MLDQSYDVAIVGAGANGLTAAAYLACAGASVIVLEARFERGGTLATDDYSTPFTYNQAQLLLPLGAALPPYHDLELGRHAVAFIEPEIAFAVALDGDTLQVRRGGRGLGERIEGLLAHACATVTPLLYERPDDAAQTAAAAGLELAAMTPDELAQAAEDERGALILRYACALAGFSQREARLGAIGAFCVARLFEPTLVAGGSKSLANGLFRAGARAGARSLVSTPVVALEPGHDAVEVALADRRRLRASSVVSTLDPATTFGVLLRERAGDELAALPDEWQLDAVAPFTAHFGIKGSLGGSDGRAPAAAAVQLVGFASESELVEHLDAVAAGRLPKRPAGHLTITSAHDPLQASPGPFGPLHTLRYETPAPYEHPDGAWERRRVAYRQSCWELLCGELSALREATLLFEFADSPSDLETRFATARRGSIRQGSLRPEQTFTGRPHPSCADGRTPVPRVYLGGGAIHAGVPGSLAGGYNVARVLCEDLELERWWPDHGASGRSGHGGAHGLAAHG